MYITINNILRVTILLLLTCMYLIILLILVLAPNILHVCYYVYNYTVKEALGQSWIYAIDFLNTAAAMYIVVNVMLIANTT